MLKTFYPIQTSFSILDYFCQSTTFDDNSELEGYNPKTVVSEKGKIIFEVSTKDNILDTVFLGEGIGLLPDIWVGGGDIIIDFMKNIWRITEDYELVTSDLDVKQERNKLMKK